MNIRKRGELGNGVLLIIAISILIGILSISATQIYAFGIATPYIENDTLKLEPGQGYVYTINVQNGDEFSYSIDFSYSSNRNVANLRNRDLFIPKKTYDNKFVFDINIPTDAQIGDLYTLSYSAKPTNNNTGQIIMTVEIKRSLKILIVDKNGEGYKETFNDKISKLFNNRVNQFVGPATLAIVLLIILALAYFIIKRFWNISKALSQDVIKENKTNTEPVLNNTGPKPIIDSIKQTGSIDEKSATEIINTELTNQFHNGYISEANSLIELTQILEELPYDQFQIIEIRQLFSERLIVINENFLAKKVLTIKDKNEMLKILK